MTDETKSQEQKDAEIPDEKKQSDIGEGDIKWREKFKQTKSELEQANARSAEEIKKYEDKISTVYKAVEKRVIDSELKAYAIAAGLQDLDFLKLIDVSAIKLSENGNVEGLEKAVNDFKTAKPALFAAEKKFSSSKNEKLPASDEKASGFDAFKVTDEEFKAKKAEFLGIY